MSYRIEVNRSAAKTLKKIRKADRKRIVEKIDSLSDNLPHPDTTKMKGNNPYVRHHGSTLFKNCLSAFQYVSWPFTDSHKVLDP